jgi:hypothetical protein
MAQITDSPLEIRLNRVEKQLRQMRGSAVFVSIAFFGIVCLTARPQIPYDGSNHTLRVRELIAEDASGRDRILIGAPVPSVAARLQDDTVGMIVLGGNGADRLALAASMPEPQAKGRVRTRVGAAAGLVVNDRDGNEHGGFAVLDNDGRALIGLDYPDSTEAIHLAVFPGEGPALVIHDSRGMVRTALV